MSGAPLVVTRRVDSTRLEIDVAPERDALEPARLAVIAFLAPHQLSAQAIYSVELVLEESLMNVVWHAFAPGAVRPPVGVCVELRDGAVVLEIDDAGRPFDPLQAPEPTHPKSIDEAVPGGLGLALMHMHAQSIRYERRGERNHLSFILART